MTLPSLDRRDEKERPVMYIPTEKALAKLRSVAPLESAAT